MIDWPKDCLASIDAEEYARPMLVFAGLSAKFEPCDLGNGRRTEQDGDLTDVTE